MTLAETTPPVSDVALEPVLAADIEPDPEYFDLKRRFWIGLALTLPLLAIGMASPFFGQAYHLSQQTLNWAQLVLATPVVLGAGKPFFERGWRSLRTRRLDMFTPIALGAGIAWLSSVVATLMPGIFPAAIPIYFDAAAATAVLVLLAQLLERRARAEMSQAIRTLMDLAPQTALRVKDDGDDVEAPLADVKSGDRSRLPPDEKVPRIVQLVAEARRSRAPAQRLADRVAAWFVPSVIAVAALAFVIWLLVGPEPRFGFALAAAISVLIIACPCALGLATPMPVTVAIGRAAQAGVLFKNAEALERLAAVDTLVVDKTGALTAGMPKVVDVVPAPRHDGYNLLRFAASLEQASKHPLARAIVNAAAAQNLRLEQVTGFTATAGGGALGMVARKRVAIGSSAFLRSLDIATDMIDAQAEAARRDGATAVYVAIDRKPAGIIAIADPIKMEAAETLAGLAIFDVEVVMATGDNATTAKVVAGKLGVQDIHAEVGPEEKAKLIAALKAKGRIVAMAGDGVEDAHALASADVGIVMGNGTDVAIEIAGIALMRGDLEGILKAKRLARAATRNIRQNLVMAFVYNVLGVPIAAGFLYPVSGLLLTPTFAALAMSLASMSVIANALRLKRVNLRGGIS